MFKLFIFIVLLFILLVQFNNINKAHETFKNMFKEHFKNEVPSDSSLVPESSYEESTNNNTENDKKCDKSKSECLFGCPKEDTNVVKMDHKKPVERKTNIDEMMVTIEETEKLCNLIEKKDKERKKREDEEHMLKQIELNKRFLIQQKAQNKQIDDLEKIIKQMTFTQKMNEVGVEKCGANADQCLTNKEKELIELVKKKQSNRKSVKINLNMENFEKNLLKEIKEKLNVSDSELLKLNSAMKNGSLNVEDLKNQINNMNNSNDTNNTNNLKNTEYNNPYRRNITSANYVNNKNNKNLSVSGCPNCKIDLSEYIDRCKIPCNKCRDPAWNCPQDKK